MVDQDGSVLKAIFLAIFVAVALVPMTGIYLALAMLGRWMDWRLHRTTKPPPGERLSTAWREVRRFLVWAIWTYLGMAVAIALVMSATSEFAWDGIAFLVTYTALILLAAWFFSVWPFHHRRWTDRVSD